MDQEKSINMQNYEEDQEWCEKYGRIPRTIIQVNGKRVNKAKAKDQRTEKETEGFYLAVLPERFCCFLL